MSRDNTILFDTPRDYAISLRDANDYKPKAMKQTCTGSSLFFNAIFNVRL